MDVLSSRLLIHPLDPPRSKAFYRDTLGLAVFREFGDPADPGLVFFIGGGLLEVSQQGSTGPSPDLSLLLQVRDVHAEHDRLRAAGVPIDKEPTLEFWGLWEMWLRDPDGIPIVLVEVPPEHPMRRDPRG